MNRTENGILTFFRQRIFMIVYRFCFSEIYDRNRLNAQSVGLGSTRTERTDYVCIL